MSLRVNRIFMGARHRRGGGEAGVMKDVVASPM
ncbi:hypothetical protein PM3016_6679 [Paenibacillus mucilaginosus 3016]|uniref:Uncharacterized protein n=1 Tax=Paenibacillus mucilaginosus 3016 TaxID=1116391 RepID=H6NMC8_9BACL|nr:hypothetical protein PM3016_6679 [Paenibacillus mucilaginosus 3016]